MGLNETNIAWTRWFDPLKEIWRKGYTLNPVTGCTHQSEGCENCYAEELYNRHKWSFQPQLHLERLQDIRKIPSGAKVFLGSVTDLFHQDFMAMESGKCPDELKDGICERNPEGRKPLTEIMEAIRARPDVTFQILTKRPWNAQRYFFVNQVPDNVWMGTTIESRNTLYRLRTLQMIRAKTRFLSCEPLLEDITEVRMGDKYASLGHALNGGKIHMIIVGAESGKNRRAFNEVWARNLRDFCLQRDIAFFYKQGSDFKPGKKDELDGRIWQDFPRQAMA